MHQQTAHRLSAEDRRRQLLDIALDLFSRRGFEGATTKEIAAAAGVTEAIIFRHFPSKQALYTAVLDRHHECGEQEPAVARWKSLMDAGDDLGLFRALLEKVISGYREDSRLQRMLLFAALEGHQAGLQLHRERSLPIFELLCQYVERRQREGAIRGDIPAPAVIGSVVGAAAHFGMMTQFFGFQTGATDTNVIDAFMDILLHGILPAAHHERATA